MKVTVEESSTSKTENIDEHGDYPISSTPKVKFEVSESGYLSYASNCSHASLGNTPNDALNPYVNEDINLDAFSPLLVPPTLAKCDIILFHSENHPHLPKITLRPADEYELPFADENRPLNPDNIPSSYLLSISSLREEREERRPLIFNDIIDSPPLTVDIISKLSQSFPHVISSIFAYLEPKDLVSLCLVSQDYKRTVISDKKNNARRIKYVTELKTMRQSVGQENWPIKKASPQVKKEQRVIFEDVKNVKSHCAIGESNAANKWNENENIIRRKKRKTDNLHLGTKENSRVEENMITPFRGKVGRESVAGSKKSKKNLRRL